MVVKWYNERKSWRSVGCLSETTFMDVQKEVFTLFKLQLYDEVLLLINKVERNFPDRLDKTIFWKACVHSLQGNEQKAIAALNDGLLKGVWWNPSTLKQDKDLKNLQNLEEFKDILGKCQNILQNKTQLTEPQMFTYGNEQADIGLISLHWRGSNVEDFAPYWLDEYLLGQSLFTFFQSSQLFGYNTYCWDNQKLAVEEISRLYSDFKEKYETKFNILTGASQGGKLAIELSLASTIHGTKGFIVVIPAIQDVKALERLLEGAKHKQKGFIITGDMDPFYDKTLELVKLFEKHHFPCKCVVVEGLGHFFPENFTHLLKEAIQYLQIEDIR